MCRRKLGPDFVKTLSVKDQAVALEWAQDNPGARPLTQGIAQVLQEQAQTDPAATRTSVENLPPGGLKQQAVFAMVSDPSAESVAWLLGQADKSSRGEWYQVATTWAFKDPDAFKKYLETADPGSLPDNLVVGGIRLR